MIIVDKYLQEREQQGNPIRVGIFGAGAMAKGLVHHIFHFTPGIVVAAVANRTVSHAIDAYKTTGETPRYSSNREVLETCISQGKTVVTDKAELLCEIDGLDLLIEMTGTIQYAASVVWRAIQNKKHVLLFNQELEATIGPILKFYADREGVMLSGSDGDQPGVIMNLYRYVKGLGLTPLICGNIKGLQDFYRTPDTQASFASRWGIKPESATYYADGTKISFEQACVANATGMKVAKRGMLGYEYQGHIDEMVSMYDLDELKKMGGMVDYVVGAKPGPGVYVFATADDAKTKHYLEYMKLGEGPLYSFYVPYHLIYLEVPSSIARMVLFNDVTISPKGKPVVEVITCAKTNLKAGKVLDGYGGFDIYGQCENAEIFQEEKLLPIGLAKDCVVQRDLPKDYVLTFDDVELPEEDLVLRLYKEQTEMFFPALTQAMNN